MADHQAIAKYFRQTLIEADCPRPNDLLVTSTLHPGEKITERKDRCSDKDKDKVVALSVPGSFWAEGRIDEDTTKVIFEAMEPEGESVELAMFPRVDGYTIDGGPPPTGYPATLVPIGTIVVLHKDGMLRPGPGRPWVPREWLAPNDECYEPLGDLSDWNEFLTLNPKSTFDDWDELKAYVTSLLATISGQEVDEELFYTAPIHSAYTCTTKAYLTLETPVRGANYAIIRTLDHLARLKQAPPLFKTLISFQDQTARETPSLADAVSESRNHLGQMNGEFPLSEKQRSALHYSFSLQPGEMLAINGPPGTGKTTLIQSVVADLWTKAALTGEEPPIIVATSNNNQAVTNILDSFAKIIDDRASLPKSLHGRWIPGFDSYGLFLCSKRRADPSYGYTYCGPDKVEKGKRPTPNSTICLLEHKDTIADIEAEFVDKYRRWDSSIDSAEQATATLHRALELLHGELCSGLTIHETIQRKTAQIEERWGGVISARSRIDEEGSALSKAFDRVSELKRQRSQVMTQWANRPWWHTLFSWVPSVRRIHRLQNASALDGADLNDLSDRGVLEHLETSLARARADQQTAKATISTIHQLLEEHASAQRELIEWENIFGIDTSRSSLAAIDIHVRHYMFKLATHYWEARWIVETKHFVDRRDRDQIGDTKSDKGIIRRWHRYAKLTPGFVSTFASISNFFTAYSSKNDAGGWIPTPMLNSIDLLIVDEAGQAVPAVASAAVALSKKALIVGDTDQIEPVWNTTEGVDKANLRSHGLLTDDLQYAEEWDYLSLTASSGNLMRVAQRQTPFHQIAGLSKGLYLTEHRRCYDEIVGYCNKLIYEGVLEPKRGAWEPHALPPLSLIHTGHPSKQVGQSRGNPQEAKDIARWLAEHQEQLIADAKKETLKESVAVITPFKQQTYMIEKEAKALGLPRITIGTIHSLQGGERPIVLFSSVYGPDDHGSRFYDSQPNMLNVAVSRAKNAFIVFGCRESFGRQNPTAPSGVLRDFIDAIAMDPSYPSIDTPVTLEKG